MQMAPSPTGPLEKNAVSTGVAQTYGRGSKPMVPFWGRCSTHFRTYFSGWIGMFTWGYDLDFVAIWDVFHFRKSGQWKSRPKNLPSAGSGRAIPKEKRDKRAWFGGPSV